MNAREQSLNDQLVNPRGKRGGFSLVEVMIAVFLMSLGMLAVGTTTVFAAQSGSVARKRVAALNFARMEMETLLTHDYSDPQLALGTRPISQPAYTGEYTVSLLDTDLKHLHVKINYTSFGGRMRQLDLEGAVSRALH